MLISKVIKLTVISKSYPASRFLCVSNAETKLKTKPNAKKRAQTEADESDFQI